MNDRKTTTPSTRIYFSFDGTLTNANYEETKKSVDLADVADFVNLNNHRVARKLVEEALDRNPNLQINYDAKQFINKCFQNPDIEVVIVTNNNRAYLEKVMRDIHINPTKLTIIDQTDLKNSNKAAAIAAHEEKNGASLKVFIVDHTLDYYSNPPTIAPKEGVTIITPKGNSTRLDWKDINNTIDSHLHKQKNPLPPPVTRKDSFKELPKFSLIQKARSMLNRVEKNKTSSVPVDDNTKKLK